MYCSDVLLLGHVCAVLVVIAVLEIVTGLNVESIAVALQSLSFSESREACSGRKGHDQDEERIKKGEEGLLSITTSSLSSNL